MGVAFEAPADFATARHDLRHEAGRLVLVDRARQRLQLTWSALPDDADPEPEALARDWRKRVLAAAPARGPLEPPPELLDLRALLPAGGIVPWAGWVSGDGTLTRTDAVARIGGMLVDAVLLDRAGRGLRPAPDTLRLLASAAPADLPEDATRWTAFGLDAAAPAGWEATAARHEPAASVLAFAGPDRRTARLWRRGMAASWFDGDAAALLDASTPDGVAAAPAVGGPPGAVAAAGREPARPWARLSGKGRHRRDLLWHDAEQNAVLGVTVRGPRRVELPDPVSFLPPA